MMRINTWNIAPFIMAIIGFIFSLKFQDMTYWGRNEPGVVGTFSMTWFWIGVGLKYVCTITSIILVFLQAKNIKRGTMSNILMSINLLIVIITLLWTIFVVIAWL
ncbi:hypothetical protein [Bacillus sp. AFS018417]|uniref:hypothetical protein n=1 Tax=Bacillus sp. AFS018417 TaxID=2033491 RepID=UPI0011459040|nr:hypothetical protein [Bacillus sp. AFS018417]